MSELTTTINFTEATAPESPTPGKGYHWDQFYGVPAQLITVTSSVLVNPNPSPYPPKQ
jgi:hypothetical protein